MRVKSVTFGFTKNLGNFQSARADCTIELGEEEGNRETRIDLAWVVAAAQVKESLGEELDAAEVEALDYFRSGKLR